MTESGNYVFAYADYAMALRQALVDDPFYIAIREAAGPGETGERALLKYLDYSIVEGERYGISFFPEGESYGVSVWSKPLPENRAREQKQQKHQFLSQQLGQNYLHLYQEITGFMSGQSASLVAQQAW